MNLTRTPKSDTERARRLHTPWIQGPRKEFADPSDAAELTPLQFRLIECRHKLLLLSLLLPNNKQVQENQVLNEM